MIKNLVKKALRKLGFEVTRSPRQEANKVDRQKLPDHNVKSERDAKMEILSLLREDPLNGTFHLKLADNASQMGNHYLAYAALKSAKVLGVDAKTVDGKLHESRHALPSLTSMNHNQYFRFFSLASEIMSRANKAEKSNFSVLDVGGGDGKLASFIPNAEYCLVEPTVNGISGTNLPFIDHSFDYVVSCHVLEHIPIRERKTFLDQLLSKAKHGVILLNPFHVKGTHTEDRLELFIKLTNAQWAKEHLEATLPKVKDIQDYSNNRGLEICIKPNGTMATSMAFVFVDYFSEKSGLRKKWEEVNKFFNEKYTAILDSKEYPTAYLIYLGWPQPKRTPVK